MDIEIVKQKNRKFLLTLAFLEKLIDGDEQSIRTLEGKFDVSKNFLYTKMHIDIVLKSIDIYGKKCWLQINTNNCVIWLNNFHNIEYIDDCQSHARNNWFMDHELIASQDHKLILTDIKCIQYINKNDSKYILIDS